MPGGGGHLRVMGVRSPEWLSQELGEKGGRVTSGDGGPLRLEGKQDIKAEGQGLVFCSWRLSPGPGAGR